MQSTHGIKAKPQAVATMSPRGQEKETCQWTALNKAGLWPLPDAVGGALTPLEKARERKRVLCFLRAWLVPGNHSGRGR